MTESRQIFAHRLFTITLIDDRVLHYRRTPERSEDLNEMKDAWAAALKTANLDTASLSVVVDSREVVGRRDDEFEAMTIEMMNLLQKMFVRVVVLMRSEVGKLHTQRLARQLDSELFITLDEDEAIRWAKGPEN